ncbi:MAG: extracellular solute-binding protein [Eubacteriales bacterium]|nr:extracellular solute-binding protein [Eubacteriales bacterium]
MAKALQLRYDLEQVDKTSVPVADAKSLQMTYRAKFFNSEVAMIPIGSWMIPEVKDVSKYPHTFQTVFAALPIWAGDTANLGLTNTANHYYALASTTKNAQAAYDFLRFYTTEGMAIRGVSMTAEKDVDKMIYVDKMVGDDKSLYDYESLKAVMTNPNWKDNVETIAPAYAQELTVMFGEEAEKFLMGQQALDATVAALKTRGDEIIAKNAK